MIKKMSSAELNNLLFEAKENISEINTTIDNISNDINNKLKIINYDSLYTNKRLQEISNSIIQKKTGFKPFVLDCNGNFDSFGYSVHPKFIRDPLNVFNISLSNGNLFFRTDVNVSVKSIYTDKDPVINSDSYNINFLKHDSITGKEIFFKEFDTNSISITINADLNNPLGPTLFNTIEIDSLFPGSYDIKDILYSYIDAEGKEYDNISIKQLVSDYRYITKLNSNIISNAGQNRLILPSKVSLKTITFDITLNYSFENNGSIVYPFGLNHIYFYDADYNIGSITTDSSITYNSYIVAEINTDKYIDIISDDIVICSTIGDIQSTLSNENIEMYLDNINNVLDTPIYADNELARNTNTLYVKIPLVKLESVVGITFNITTR